MPPPSRRHGRPRVDTRRQHALLAKVPRRRAAHALESRGRRRGRVPQAPLDGLAVARELGGGAVVQAASTPGGLREMLAAGKETAIAFLKLGTADMAVAAANANQLQTAVRA